MGKIKLTLIIILSGIILAGSMLALDYFMNVKWFGFIEPQKENVRREIFTNTRSYNEAKVQDLLKYRLEYLKAKEDEKEAIASTIRLSFAEFDESKLQPELRNFLRKIKYGEY